MAFAVAPPVVAPARAAVQETSARCAQGPSGVHRASIAQPGARRAQQFRSFEGLAHANRLAASRKRAPRSFQGPAFTSAALATESPAASAAEDVESDGWDVIVIGSGIGGLTTAAQTVAKGLKTLVLESYVVPGGSSAYFERDGYTFDVGASMIFGFGDKGTTNLLTRALALVGEKIETIPDPVQIDYHLPNDLDIQVHRDYEKFIAELSARFPHEAAGIRAFYDECWAVFNCLNAMDLLSLEEPRYLARVFFEHPLACLGLVKYLPLNVGAIARKHIRDEELLRFIDMECYCWSVVPAERTPMINAGMVFSDRHFGGINYPRGGVGQIAAKLARGIEATGLGRLRYRSRATRILTEAGAAVGVETADGRTFRGKRIVSNATRWDTFGKLLPEERTPITEKWWRGRYEKSPSFLSMHLGVRAEALPAGTECHHILLEDWARLEATDGTGTLFVSIPTLLDPSLAPPGRHIVHAFAPASIDDFQRAPSRPAPPRTPAQRGAGGVTGGGRRVLPGLGAAVEFKEVGSPRTHRRYLGRADGTYGPIPSKVLPGLLGMPFNRTPIPNLYCVGDSTFPGQGLNAVAFSGFACGWRIAADLGKVSLLGR
eukprot:tig00001095_g7025.t1